MTITWSGWYVSLTDGWQAVCMRNAFHCVRVVVTSCVHVRMPYWVVRACMNAWFIDDCDDWWWCVVRSCERLTEWICWIEWMNGLTVLCVCVCLCLCVCGWVVRLTCLQGGGAVYIYQGQGTFTNCNFTSNSTTQVSLEEEHVYGCMWYVCVHDAEVVPSIHVFLTYWLIPTSSIRLL